MTQTHQKPPVRPPARAAHSPAADVARLEDRPQVELFALAQKLGIGGYAEMSRAELIEALRRR